MRPGRSSTPPGSRASTASRRPVHGLDADQQRGDLGLVRAPAPWRLHLRPPRRSAGDDGRSRQPARRRSRGSTCRTGRPTPSCAPSPSRCATGSIPRLSAYIEYSNEVWNWQFEQAPGRAPPPRPVGGPSAPGWRPGCSSRACARRGWRRSGTRSSREAADARLVKVIATQTGWLGLEASAARGAVVGRGEPRANRPPATLLRRLRRGGLLRRRARRRGEGDEVRLDRGERGRGGGRRRRARPDRAGPGGVSRGARHRRLGRARRRRRSASALAPSSLCEILPYQAEVARVHGLELVMYEGGTHVVGGRRAATISPPSSPI